MLFPLIKANVVKKRFKFCTTFLVKTKFVDLDFNKCSSYKDFRLDYLPLRDNQANCRALVCAWYLVLTLRLVKASISAHKVAVFPYRRTKLFAKYQDTYEFSLTKHFYNTLIDHRNLFYCLTVSSSFTDCLSLISCLYFFKGGTLKIQTVIKRHPILPNFYSDLIRLILQSKWEFKVLKFV